MIKPILTGSCATAAPPRRAESAKAKATLDRFLKTENLKIVTGVMFGNVAAAVVPDVLDAGGLYVSTNTAAAPFAGKGIDLCADGDPICSQGRNPFAHTSYEKTAMVSQAAGFVAAML